jgi:hypothetical protein
MTTSEERKGLNEARFRDANEKLQGHARDLVEGEETLVPFLCECVNRECTQVVRMTLAEYEEVREDGRHGIGVPGHEDLSVEDVVAAHDRYFVTKKFGQAGQIAEETDPRA